MAGMDQMITNTRVLIDILYSCLAWPIELHFSSSYHLKNGILLPIRGHQFFPFGIKVISFSPLVVVEEHCFLPAVVDLLAAAPASIKVASLAALLSIQNWCLLPGRGRVFICSCHQSNCFISSGSQGVLFSSRGY